MPAEGINIFSGEKNLGGALTNPTALARRKGSIVNDYPVKFRGKTHIDAESAYHAHSRDISFDAKQEVCFLVVTAKLLQHPMLVEAITRKGGVAWLETCRHQTWAKTEGMQKWEGFGRESAYIRALIRAYEAVESGCLPEDPYAVAEQGVLFE